MREPLGQQAPTNTNYNNLFRPPQPPGAGPAAGGGGQGRPTVSAGRPPQPTVAQLQEVARRQQAQIEAQQQLLVAKEQRLKFLRQQDYRHHQMAAEYERLRRLREKVESQELKLRKLRSLRGQPTSQGQQGHPASVTADLESIRGLFNEKEKELSMAVQKVEDLTHQLEDLRSGRVNNSNSGGGRYPPQLVELERLRRELAYRKQLNEQQNNMIAQQRAQLGMGKEEMTSIDERIVELQERLARKRLMNQQLASQISAATSAKQAQLRAIQQGMQMKNKNKPVSTVEPFQRGTNTPNYGQVSAPVTTTTSTASATASGVSFKTVQAAAAVAAADNDKVNNSLEDVSGGPGGQARTNLNHDKYQTLPFNTKFTTSKVEALKAEKENNNVAFASDLPPPPPLPVSMANLAVTTGSAGQPRFPDYQGNYTSTTTTTSVAPPAAPEGVTVSSWQTNKDDPSPPPYKPAPPPAPVVSDEASTAAITIRPGAAPAPPTDLSVSFTQPSHSLHGGHPSEEGTSVDDEGASADNEGSKDTVAPSSVHISINRRIEMPPAFHFPEDQTPPSDLLASSVAASSASVAPEHGGDDHYRGSGETVDRPRDLTDNAMYPMMSQIYKEFDHLSPEEQSRIQAMFAAAVQNRQAAQDKMELEEDSDNQDEMMHRVPVVIETEKVDPSKPRPKGIIRPAPQEEGKSSHDRRIMFDPLALLLDASLEGELDLVRKTAGQVEDPSAANDEGITALHNAICAGHIDIVQFLVTFGCDVNAQDSDGWTPLHCAASCNNLSMVKFLVEHGACVLATTLSDHETAAEKCEEDEEGFDGCSEYLYSVQEKLGTVNQGRTFAVYNYEAENEDEVTFRCGDELTVVRKGDELEKEWWWATTGGGREGYIPRNLLGLYPRVQRQAPAGSSPEDSEAAATTPGVEPMAEESDTAATTPSSN